VQDYLQRALLRHVGPSAFTVRLSATDFLIAQPNATRLAGQISVMNSLRETLHYFLGEVRISDMIVHEVTRLTQDLVYGQRLDVLTVEASAAEEELQACDVEPAVRLRSAWSPFAASDGRMLRVACRLEPVVQLKTSMPIGRRVAREVFQAGFDRPVSQGELQRLSRADLERIDFAGVERAIGQLKAGGGRDPSLILTLSLTTLSDTRAREVLRGLLEEAQHSVQHGLICEISDIEGAPLGALANAISFVRPFCRYVTGRVSPSCTGRLMNLKGIGLAGLSVECPASVGGDAEFLGWIRSRCAMLKAIGRAAMVYRLPSLRNAAMASLLGLTHGSVRAEEGPGLDLALAG
jgi:hypothetical protein